jgi:predicted Zn-dependent protease
MKALRSKSTGLPALAFLMVASLAGCARNPVTGQRQLVLISEAQELAYGREAHPQILQEFGKTDDPALQAYVNEIGQRLARISHRPDLEWHFTVVDLPIVNAFALPGGYVYFTRQILAYMNTEAELASVMGHEIGHVTARHSVTQMSRQQLLGLGIGLGGVFSPTFGQFGGLAEIGAGLLSLKYSRDDERQSDQLGVEYMARAGYDPREMSKFFQVFEAMQEESGQVVPNWLASHPAPPDRIEATRRMAEETMARLESTDLTVGRDTHLQRIAGIVYGENPREGFTENGTFLHPDLRFRLTYPQGWRLQNTRSSVLFGEPRGAALLALTLADAPQGTTPEALARRIANQSNVRLVEGGRTSIHGNPAWTGVFLLQQTSGQVLQVQAGFVSHRERLYQIVGVADRRNFGEYASRLRNAIGSFAELTDARALGVQPDRVEIRSARAGDTLTKIAEEIANPRVTARDLGVLNRIPPDEPLPAGSRIKIVRPGR